MNKDASDFMIQEYDQIASAYFGLRDQVNDWFKSYLSLIGLPLTVLAAVFRLSGQELTASIGQLPDVVSVLLVLIALLGLFVVLNIVSMRMEMILYARTINGVRRYFGEMDMRTGKAHGRGELSEFLILPTSDAVPPFFESWRAMFWQVVTIGCIDGLVLGVAIHSLARIYWFWCAIAGAVYGLLHLAVYGLMAQKREKGWTVRFPESLGASEH